MRARIWLLGVVLLLVQTTEARAWDAFRSENSDVQRGNEALGKGQADAALSAYDNAARALPNEPGVHLDRGLALLSAGKLDAAREAFRVASQGQVSPELRGAAQYNLGLAFLRQADAAASAENLEEGQKYLREAVDAFKSSLRNAPKNRDAGWNLELAKRRLVDLEQKKKQQEEQKKQEEEQKKQEEEQKQNENQDDSDGGQPNDADAGAGEQKQDTQDEQKDDGQKSPEQQQQADKGQQQDPNKPEQKPGDKQGQDQQPKEQPAKPENQPNQAPEQESGKPAPQLPEHMQKALDALSDNDENLQKHRARMRAQQRPQRVEKDW